MSNVYQFQKRRKGQGGNDEHTAVSDSLLKKLGMYLLKSVLYMVRLVFFWFLNIFTILCIFILTFSRIFVVLIFLAALLSMAILYYTHTQTALKLTVQIVAPFIFAFIVHFSGKVLNYLIAYKNNYRSKYGL